MYGAANSVSVTVMSLQRSITSQNMGSVSYILLLYCIWKFAVLLRGNGKIKKLLLQVFKYLQVFTHLHISFLTEEFESIKYKADPQPLPSREIPPYNGFGSEEDSLATCLSLRPKPTRRDFKKFMEKDRLEETNATSQNIHILTLRLKLQRDWK